jgi:hypothetical protein
MKAIIVICEGESERAYLQELNEYLREQYVSLVPKLAGTGYFNEVVRKYKEECKRNKGNKKNFYEYYIWVDKDIYERNEQKNMTKFNDLKYENIVDKFRFNIFNFEDFLMLHYSRDKILEYQKKCEKHNHFRSPMKEKEYLPLFKETCDENYEKGSLPKGFEISEESLKRLSKNNKDESIKFKSDFVKVIKKLLIQDLTDEN